ncbi:MAG: isoprenylcysteine carboxylmethyltransferase family protein [Proteobacteria bacterium]|nr:isoprenylcysteine carboxylmethyltransferase family protein [Pseudomonadota bacterium]
MARLELRIPPPAVALVVAAAMWLVARAGPALDAPFTTRVAVFIALALVGVALALAGKLEFRRARTTANPFRPENASTLVATGVYRFTRNPMYLGLALAGLGWAAFLCSAWALAGPVIFVVYISRFQIAPEERVLAAKFGTAYAEYASRVRRWI